MSYLTESLRSAVLCAVLLDSVKALSFSRCSRRILSSLAKMALRRASNNALWPAEILSTEKFPS
jgi:hypothetical protein